MAKSINLFGLLSAVALLVCGYAGSTYIEQGTKIQEQRQAGFSNEYRKTYQVKPTTYESKVKQIYDAEIGVRERGLNTGKRVEEYLAYVNLKTGDPWCAAFVCWVYGQAGVENPRSGWSPDLFPVSKLIWSKAGSRPGESGTKSQESRHPQSVTYDYSTRQTTGNRQLTTPRTGDIFALFFPEKNRIAHAGFIDQWDGTWLITVEGNTNLSGSREGDGVYRKRRLVRSVYQVARYIREQ